MNFVEDENAMSAWASEGRSIDDVANFLHTVVAGSV